MNRAGPPLRPSLWQAIWFTAAHLILSAALYVAAWYVALGALAGELSWTEWLVTKAGTWIVFPFLYLLAPLLQAWMSMPLLSAVALGMLVNSLFWSLALAMAVNALRRCRHAAVSAGAASADEASPQA